MNQMHWIEKLLILICGGGIILLPLLSFTIWDQSSPITSIMVVDPFPSSNLLFALRTVESSGRADAVSEQGARGLYQIMPQTWRDHSEQPFSDAFDPVESQIVAVQYLWWIHTTLYEWMGEEPTLEEILSCWHGGIGRFRRRGYSLEMMPGSTREFVRRTINEMSKRG